MTRQQQQKRKAPAFQFYADDFLAGVIELSNEEVGIYIRLLCVQWTKGTVTDRAARVIGTGSESLQYVLESKFEKTNGGYINRRLEKVRETAEERARNGSKGGRSSREADYSEANDKQTPSKTEAKPEQTPEQNSSKPQANEAAKINPPSPSPSPSPSSVSSSISEEENTSAGSGLSYHEKFEEFWISFPKTRRTKKQEAYRKWKIATKRVDADTLTAKATEYAASEVGRSQFAVMPSVWLNGGCWEDDPEAWNLVNGKPAASSGRKSNEGFKPEVKEWTP